MKWAKTKDKLTLIQNIYWQILFVHWEVLWNKFCASLIHTSVVEERTDFKLKRRKKYSVKMSCVLLAHKNIVFKNILLKYQVCLWHAATLWWQQKRNWCQRMATSPLPPPDSPCEANQTARGFSNTAGEPFNTFSATQKNLYFLGENRRLKIIFCSQITFSVAKLASIS